MSSNAVLKTEPMAIVACTVSRDVQIFDLLIEDMEAALGESWGDLNFDDALSFLQQPEADDLQFLAVAMDSEDEDNLDLITSIISAAKARQIKVILITEDVSPASLHTLLREGGDEFVPYPLPEDELALAIERVLTPPEQIPVAPELQNPLKASGDREGVLIAVHGMAGGTGATTLAVNLAWELTGVEKDNAPRVCLLDLDFQFGTTSTYLDLPRRETVLEAAHVYFATIELDMRSAQNTLRIKRALQSEDLPFDKLRFVLNRAPGFTDLSGKSRVKRLAESLGISIEVQIPDGGKQVSQTADHGTPLGVTTPKSQVRKEIMKLAQSVHQVNTADEAETA